MKEQYNRVWAEVDLDAIRSNICAVQEHLHPGTKICAVIKADGYGHGAVNVAQNIHDLVDFFAVATIDEGMELRGAGVKEPILVLGYVHPSMAAVAARHHIRLTVYDYEMAQEISAQVKGSAEKALIHLKLDTGMGRIGLMPSEKSLETIKKIRELEGISIEGIFTHFANADAESLENAKGQLKQFQEFVRKLEENGIRIPVKHCSNSAGATCLREADMDMVRLGISMYGLYPSSYVNQITLRPALELKSHVIMVKTVAPGASVGYGSTWTAAAESRIATVSVGYADGYNRSLSNKGYVLIRGRKFPVVGRVCMDQIMVDVTGDIEVENGDEVVLVGHSQDQYIGAGEIADLAGSFNYEFVCGFGRRIPRIYYREGQCVGVKNVFDVYYD